MRFHFFQVNEIKPFIHMNTINSSSLGNSYHTSFFTDYFSIIINDRQFAVLFKTYKRLESDCEETNTELGQIFLQVTGNILKLQGWWTNGNCRRITDSYNFTLFYRHTMKLKYFSLTIQIRWNYECANQIWTNRFFDPLLLPKTASCITITTILLHDLIKHQLKC